ncbi:5-methylcytosine-specific restriction enzyme A [Seinonella peptonophila]|uniref:5-methylcytosine-specific restriction enzyme A n=1 Tax=Seinonella peptonophila TaxID=112248 RepID=A0A1M4Z431_9BACL|nr:DUF3578 domain-containing protein [Seinonella peptonophila]SHF12492.1 5-methylcytosine-specific restriction enzyme A [Seinonella peptonophila]
MREIFERIFDRFLTHGKSADNWFEDFVQTYVSDILTSNAFVNREQYFYKGFIVEDEQGRSYIPKITISDRSITSSDGQGYYIAYLFCSDFSGFYISFNQGWSFYRDQGQGNYLEMIQKISTAWQGILYSPLADFTHSIDLKSDDPLAKELELGHICGKFYQRENIPADDQLVNDLRNLLGVYRELKGRLNDTDVQSFHDQLIGKRLYESDSSFHDRRDLEYQLSIYESLDNFETETYPKFPYQDDLFHTEVRNPRMAKQVLQRNNFKCEIDPNHFTFISNITGKNYVEAHHLIPTHIQSQFVHQLDIPSNIISLCPNCHRAIHHSATFHKKKLLEKLFNRRKAELRKAGLDIHIDQLYNLYGVI